MEEMTGVVFHIQKFCTDDGPGIRSTVFLKGCPLRCLWCHNPEGLSCTPLLEYDKNSCVFCKACEAVCPNGCHSFQGEEHRIDRNKCVSCGRCVEACLFGGVHFCGQTMTVSQVMKDVLRDRAFYQTSGGGMTVSGGEPLMHPDFTRELFRRAKEEGLHTCLESSGYGDTEKLRQIMPYVDLFLFDIKETDEERHKKATGVSNRLILKNLQMLDESGAVIRLRCPIIPGINDREEHFAALSRLAKSLHHPDPESDGGIQIMPYHMLGKGKEDRFGASAAEAFHVPAPEEIALWNQLIRT